MIEVKGNLLEAEEKHIAHVVNCDGVMGSGLAPQIKKKWPNVFEEYRDFCKLYGNDPKWLLGTSFTVETGDGKVIHNMFAMPTMRSFDYYSASLCLNFSRQILMEEDDANDQILAITHLMGCGLAGGNWKIFSQIIESMEKTTGTTVKTYEYNP